MISLLLFMGIWCSSLILIGGSTGGICKKKTNIPHNNKCKFDTNK